MLRDRYYLLPAEWDANIFDKLRRAQKFLRLKLKDFPILSLFENMISINFSHIGIIAFCREYRKPRNSANAFECKGMDPKHLIA